MKRDAKGQIVYSRDPRDPFGWPEGMTTDEMMARLKLLNPQRHADILRALELMRRAAAEYDLREAWGREPQVQH
jgi:hypothetical protein